MKLTLLWNPYSTNNIYARNWRRGYIKPKPKEQKESYILQANIQKTGFFQWAVGVNVELYFWDKRKRDIDNYNKLWMDALSWVVYEDDKQIKTMHITKNYDKENPRIEVDIEELI